MTFLIHCRPGDERMKAYLSRTVGEKDDFEYCSADSVPKLDKPEAYQAIISAELPNAQVIAAAYKHQGARVTILGKQGPTPESAIEDEE